MSFDIDEYKKKKKNRKCVLHDAPNHTLGREGNRCIVKFYGTCPKVNHLDLVQNLHVKYHDPSSSGSPDIFLTMPFMG